MCTETIALCESCGFHRHMHYHRCMAWLWTYRQIKWGFTTPLDSIPKAKNCPFLDGEVKLEIEPGRCPDALCPGHKLKAEMDEVSTDIRTDADKIEEQRIKLGLKKRTRPQGFQDPLEVGRPHQRKIPVVILDGHPNDVSGRSQGKQRVWEDQAQYEMLTPEQEHAGGIAIPLHSPAAEAPVFRQRKFNGPMMLPH
ncbi:uncharacterized protein ColSpa_01849 [Colletotrichum spaethianum]|uniref:Uncharacterized protein n=1 Tax=Colletotrichum spaethianum TaxID=700344 RepID=A0AA37L499_9PEZI|nr:uncharacterized protein ColSpa_01849 [Colletotrichum spaethianum]GKT41668.1 hypothetical protein ColSpa_01849 [Colletotrichum spaethianum]